MLSWQFNRLSVTGTPGPMDATKESKMRVKLNHRDVSLSIIRSLELTNVSRSVEMNDPTLP